MGMFYDGAEVISANTKPKPEQLSLPFPLPNGDYYIGPRTYIVSYRIPRIVCLCGSTRFRELYRSVNAQETLKGNIVLSVGCFAGDPEHGHQTHKVNLDELHKRKIDLADEVIVLTVDGYIGSSTRSEIDYAKGLRKPIRYVDEPGT